jgi:hypothetical protein
MPRAAPTVSMIEARRLPPASGHLMGETGWTIATGHEATIFREWQGTSAGDAWNPDVLPVRR